MPLVYSFRSAHAIDEDAGVFLFSGRATPPTVTVDEEDDENGNGEEDEDNCFVVAGASTFSTLE